MDDHESALENLSQNVSTKGVPRNEQSPPQKLAAKGVSRQNPVLFDFEHPTDPELTPRKRWQQKVSILDAQLAEEKS